MSDPQRQVAVAIIGFHKGGTTALLKMLAQHPDVCVHPGGQWPFFLQGEDYAERYPEVMEEQFGHAPPDARALVRDDSLSQDPVALARFAELNPDAVLVLSLRDPAERAYSAYWHAVERGFDSDVGFDEVLRRGVRYGPGAGGVHLTNYLGMGFYHRALAEIERVFPRRQLVLVRSKDLAADPTGPCQRVFDAAGLPAHQVSPVVANQAVTLRSRRMGQLLQRDSAVKRVLRGALPLDTRVRARARLASLNAKTFTYPPMSSEQRAALDELYSEDLRRLREDYGIDVGPDAH